MLPFSFYSVSSFSLQIKVRHFTIHRSLLFSACSVSFSNSLTHRIFSSAGRKFQANAAGDSDGVVDPPKVEDKIGAVPHGLSTDSDVVKRCVLLSLSLPFDFLFWHLNPCYCDFKGGGVDLEEISSEQRREV